MEQVTESVYTIVKILSYYDIVNCKTAGYSLWSLADIYLKYCYAGNMRIWKDFRSI